MPEYGTGKKSLAGMRIAVLTLGCKVNQYETEGMRELLIQAGAEAVEFGQAADICLINTCSVTNIAERKSRQMLHRARKQNPRAIVIAVGCYVQTVPEEVKSDGSVDLIVGNNCKKDIVQIIEAYLQASSGRMNAPAWLDIAKVQDYEELGISRMWEHTRSYIKIQDGCNQFCSYCIIPYVRGRIRSRRPEDVLAEVRRLAAQGCREVVLTGIHIASYGKDWEDAPRPGGQTEGAALLGLLRQISRVEGILRIRLGSLEPRIMTEEFVEALREIPEVCPHFHLSLQSGCNETLQRMNRKYTIDEYKRSCDRLRRAYDRPALTTDVIVGFPGETEEEFEATCQSLEELNLYEIHVFQYSRRRGTAAETMPDQVPEPEKSRRSDVLLAMTARQKQAYEDSFLGETLQVLIEEKVKGQDNWYVGHTERYMRLEVASGREIRNQLIETVYTGIRHEKSGDNR